MYVVRVVLHWSRDLPAVAPPTYSTYVPSLYICTPWDPAAPACLSEIACKSDWMGFMVSSWFPAAGMHNHNQSQLANISQDFTSLDLKSKD